MPLAAERELRYGCSSEGGAWFLSRQEEKKKCLIAFGLTNNGIDLSCEASRTVMFRLGLVTSEQR